MTDGPAPPEAFVPGWTTLRPVPFVPELRLHLADDAIKLWEDTERALRTTDQPPPFWAFGWPGGLALARHILDHPEQVAGRTVLDLGSGSGLVAIAAARAGAATVLASEPDPFAVAAIQLNARANQVTVGILPDVLDGSGEECEVVLAADVCYEKLLAERVLGLLRRARDRSAKVLIGDPGRAFLPRDLLTEIASYEVPAYADLEDTPVKHVMIMTLP